MSRPVIDLRLWSYNSKVGLALVCPLTPHVKGYPFEVALPAGGEAEGAILADQIKSLDWRVRQAVKFEKVSQEAMLEVLAKISVLAGWGESR